ncbi:nuclear transport factor 2 family protein [Kineococcus arenarius]|uniref:nuclear transport factor 2 family protein n=1 Tax=unclassified Kineococcus TaxID=2621656 RepID=UPI003D7D427E
MEQASGHEAGQCGDVDPRSEQAIARWRAAGEAGDAAAAVSALSRDVRLISPITERFAFTGRAQVHELLEVALEAVEGIVYTDQVLQGRTAALFYEGSVAGVRLHEAQRLRLDAEGLISEITLFVRPLPALTALMRRLGPELTRRGGHPVLARLIPVAAGALHSMATTGENEIMPRTAPR